MYGRPWGLSAVARSVAAQALSLRSVMFHSTVDADDRHPNEYASIARHPVEHTPRFRHCSEHAPNSRHGGGGADAGCSNAPPVTSFAALSNHDRIGDLEDASGVQATIGSSKDGQ